MTSRNPATSTFVTKKEQNAFVAANNEDDIAYSWDVNSTPFTLQRPKRRACLAHSDIRICGCQGGSMILASGKRMNSGIGGKIF